jgi:hypothetical protein
MRPIVVEQTAETTLFRGTLPWASQATGASVFVPLIPNLINIRSVILLGKNGRIAWEGLPFTLTFYTFIVNDAFRNAGCSLSYLLLKAEPREQTYHIFNTARMTSRYVAFTMAGPDKC